MHVVPNSSPNDGGKLMVDPAKLSMLLDRTICKTLSGRHGSPGVKPGKVSSTPLDVNW